MLDKSVWSQKQSEYDDCRLVSHPLKRESLERSVMRGYLGILSLSLLAIIYQ